MNPAQSSSANPWGQQQQNPPIDPFQRSSQAYQSGYLMSAVQGNPMPSNSQRFDNPALLPTKSKAHHLAHPVSDDYGADSLFDRPKTRHAMDEDAPPVNSVTDIISQAQLDPLGKKLPHSNDPPRRLGLASPNRNRTPSHNHSQSLSQRVTSPSEVTYVLVFGFPPEQYDVVASTFASADASAPERPPHDRANWFKIGYRNAWDAQRALRRNGEVVENVFMIGVVSVEAEMDVAAPTSRSTGMDFASSALGRPQSATAFGKPLAIAPSSSAFRPQSAAPSSGAVAKPASTSSIFDQDKPANGAGNTWGNKISDMIFGW
ncbi:hypothetical protein BKA62DRAFT_826174 [Auriculariales sp. MPI-PUGE-AT-0066]|nr:hypothetical protein BKA62DRAFT_826174 [Auriculariales sp. MPI-PUGE-AT-0066]